MVAGEFDGSFTETDESGRCENGVSYLVSGYRCGWRVHLGFQPAVWQRHRGLGLGQRAAVQSRAAPPVPGISPSDAQPCASFAVGLR